MINFGCPEIYLENNINNEKRLHILLGHHSHPLKEEKMNYKVYQYLVFMYKGSLVRIIHMDIVCIPRRYTIMDQS